MDGSAEVNETVENPAADALHFKRVENDRPLPEQSNPDNAAETNDPIVYEDTEWSEHFTMLQSSVISPEVAAGQSLNGHLRAHSRPEPHYSDANSISNHGKRVAELTLKNFRNTNLYIGDSATSGEKLPNRMGLLQSFTRLVGKSRDKALGVSMSMGHSDDFGNRLLLHSDAQRPILATESEPNDCRLSEHMMDNPIIQSTTPTQAPVGITTKVLSSSGFQQYFIKTTLKGTGITYQGNYSAPGPVISPQVERPNANLEITSKVSHSPAAKADATSFNHLGTSNPAEERITLREWLKPKCQKINKAERVHIFKQILDFVDTCHSEQLVLQHLRPSYFFKLPTDQVKYTGSFVPQHQMEFPDSPRKDIHYLDNSWKRKRITDQHKETSEVSTMKLQNFQYKICGDIDHHKYPCRSGFRGNVRGEENEVDRTRMPTSESSVLELDRRNNFHMSFSPCTSSSGSQLSTYDLLKLEESWYASPEEITNRVFSFSSNIYSLGVLLFEIFCSFKTWELHFSAMLNLRQRILPPTFLSESPKEAGFCLWLLHPDPSSRPKSTDILKSDLLSEPRDLLSLDNSSALIEDEDAEADFLLHFLLSLKEQREKKALKLETELGYLSADIEESQRRQFPSVKLSLDDRDFNCFSEKPVPHAETISLLSNSNEYKKRLMENIHQLDSAYFSRFAKTETAESIAAVRSDCGVLKIHEKYSHIQNGAELTDSLGTFFDGLCKYARNSKFEVCGNLKNVDFLSPANVICSLSFDPDEEYFAAAGVSKKIKIFEFSALLNDTVDVHYPVLELSSRSKLSCVSWNNYIKNYLASTDYEGAIQLWDASVGQGFTRFTEHKKRAWSANFSVVDPTKLASGGDDCTVKLWSINERSSTDTIRTVANVCCVQFPFSSHLLAFGSADCKIYSYDIRNTRIPWCTLSGHGKAVSFVKFVDSETLVSASTDNTLKLWDLKRTNPNGLSTSACSLTLSGHTNEKNFVGLSVSDGYIVCGSETNEVYAYYRTFSMPLACHKFGSIDPITAQETSDDCGHFVSSVCWRGKSNMVVAANSTGRLKVLKLV